MFSVEELSTVLESAWFQTGRRELERDILRSRLGLELASIKGEEKLRALRRYTGAVLSSLARWQNPREGIARQLCLSAADIEAALALLHIDDTSATTHRKHVLRSAVLYDVAGMPGVAATLAQRDGLATITKDFFSRSGQWGRLSTASQIDSSSDPDRNGHANTPPPDGEELVNAALADVLAGYAAVLQKPTDDVDQAKSDLSVLENAMGNFSSFLSRDECSALRRALDLRAQNATLKIAATHCSLAEAELRNLELPGEMWPVQRRAIEEGLLSPNIISFGLAAPTGTGKTALMRMLIADFLTKNPEKKAIYVSPSRALSAQVAHDLSAALGRLNMRVLALGGHLAFHPAERLDPENASILVFTPEKADLIMRLMPESLGQVGLVIVDEAHHIEQGTRGILLEFYLWRLRSLVPASSRFVQLSAVAPNIKDMVDWLGGKEHRSRSVTLDWRTNRLRMGIFERRTDGSATVQFGTEAPYILLERDECPEDPIQNIAMLANRLSERGIVLVLATSPGDAEAIAKAIADIRADATELNETATRLDAHIERELYADAPLRQQLKKRVVYHHAQLPPRIRSSIEQCVSDRQIDIVCATTTLGEGVNFPFSTVVVDSLVGREYQISPRGLWNIAGRAGRFGVDSEGHCILFRPSRWRARLTNYTLEDYLRTNLADIPPVRSALANAISDLKTMVDNGSVEFKRLANVSLKEIQKERKASTSISAVRGLINVMRVGYAHANASKTISVDLEATPEFDQDLLASRQLDKSQKEFAQRLGRQQRKVIKDALEEDAQLVEIAARVGWSLETQKDLYDWLQGLENWRLEQFGGMVIGGKVLHPEKLGYLVGPLAKHMAEFEGASLGGYTSYIAEKWITGLPLTEIRSSQKTAKKMDFGRLVHVIYSRIQYMLPWALFGLHELLQFEAKRRGIRVGDGVKDLSVLAGEGVPNFDALTLIMQLDLERVDATRLAGSYQAAQRDTDIMGWFKGLSWERLVGVVRGADNRRLDPDLRARWQAART